MSYEKRAGSNFGLGASGDILASNSEYGVQQARVELGPTRPLPISDTSTYIASGVVREATASALTDADLLAQQRAEQATPVAKTSSGVGADMLAAMQKSALATALRPSNVSVDTAYSDSARNPANYMDAPTRPTLTTVNAPTAHLTSAPTKNLELMTEAAYISEAKEAEVTGRSILNAPTVGVISSAATYVESDIVITPSGGAAASEGGQYETGTETTTIVPTEPAYVDPAGGTGASGPTGVTGGATYTPTSNSVVSPGTSGGSGAGALLMIGGVGLLAYLLLRK